MVNVLIDCFVCLFVINWVRKGYFRWLFFMFLFKIVWEKLVNGWLELINLYLIDIWVGLSMFILEIGVYRNKI